MEAHAHMLFSNLKLLEVDLEALQKQYRIPLLNSMFDKPNAKGMALLIHTLICKFDDDGYRPMFAGSWFPYTMVEMKEFK